MDDYTYNAKNTTLSMIAKLENQSQNKINFFCEDYYRFILSITRLIKYGDFKYKDKLSSAVSQVAISGDINDLRGIADILDLI